MKRSLSIDTFKRYYSLKSNRIYSLPIVILMPHSRCNCRCVMCDIWKGNKIVEQLEESDVQKLLDSLTRLNTKEVVMSGGEALMHPAFFRLCKILKSNKIKLTILSTGMLLKKYANEIIKYTDEVIVSLDGSKNIHDKIRNIPDAYEKLKEGVKELKNLNQKFTVTARCVIQKENFEDFPNIVDSAHEIGLDQISFLAADVTTDAFNRPEFWDDEKVGEVSLSKEQLPVFKEVIDSLIQTHSKDFEDKFIAESPEKIKRFYDYYAAFCQITEFPKVRCNAPWISAVVEVNGSVRPCFFHQVVGNIKAESLNEIVNSERSISFRKNLDVDTNPICLKCVCSLNLSPFTKI